METKIITETKNPHLEREEIIAEIVTGAAPNEESVIEALGKDASLTVVKKIQSNFGRNTFKVNAVVYDSVESREKIETIPAKVKKKMAAEKKAAEDKAKAEEEKAKADAEAAKKAEEEAKAAEAEAKAAETEAPKEEAREETKTDAPVEEAKTE